MTNWVVGAAAVGALALVGCSTGPPIHSALPKGSPFCTDLGTFATQVEAVTANETLAQLIPQVEAVHQSLLKLQGEAPAGDTVGGHSVRTDLGTEASAFAELSSRLNGASSTDPNAVGNALSGVNAQQGGALTDATNRLDDYSKTVCGVSAVSPNPTTTTTPASPTASTTAAPASTTAAPASTTAAPTSTTAAP